MVRRVTTISVVLFPVFGIIRFVQSELEELLSVEYISDLQFSLVNYSYNKKCHRVSSNSVR